MNLTFLAPWAFAGAALLSIPILVHLFKPRRVRQTPFSSLRWLRLTPQKLSRRIQWHQVLLFLLRAAFLMLLVLALARPLWNPGGARYRERFIVVDVGHGMNYRISGQPPPIERALVLARELVQRNQPGDRTAILVTGSQTRLLAPLSTQPENYLAELERTQAGLTETDLGSALLVVRGLLARPRADAAAEVWFVTANQQHAWQGGPPAGFLEGLPVATAVHVVDVGPAGPQNAWIAEARLLEYAKPNRRVFSVEMGCVGDSTQDRKLVLDAAPGLPAQSRQVLLSPGKATVVELDVPAGADLRTGILRFHFAEPDGLPADDEFLLNLDTQGALRVLLVEGPVAGLHLRTAIESLRDRMGLPVQLTPTAVGDLRAEEIARSDVILLADVSELKDDLLAAVEERIRGGSGLAIVLGEAGKPAFLNTRLFKALQPTEGLLPAPVRPTLDTDEQLVPLTDVRWSHPLLRGLNDPRLGDLAQVRFRRWYEFTADLPDATAILAQIDGGAPAILERSYGSGRVVILNTGAADHWCDGVKRNSYLPLVDRLLSQLGATGVRASYAVGEMVVFPLADWHPGEAVAAITPGGQRLATPIRNLGNGRATISFEAAEAGVYHIERPSGSAAIVVQAGRGDSTLSPMDATTLKQWWAPAECQLIRGDDLVRHLDSEAGRIALWPWLLLAAGVVLLAEMYLVHYLCPRASPHLAQNIVGRRGLLRPASSE
jgi:hypothetical protein